jgi:DNA polymerase-3 subunit gamma/tau
MTTTTESYKKHRPRLLKHVLGQPQAVAVLRKFIDRGEIPHAMLFTGPSGCGKTTLARIMAGKVECAEEEVIEINAANFRGIDTVREIGDRMNMAPLHGKARVWVVDECHQLSTAAQNTFLKLLEDPPGHVYFMLCTTDPAKLIKTVITRCTEVKLKPMTDESLEQLIKTVMELEKMAVTDDAVAKILECCDSSARKALVLLDSVRDLEATEQEAAIEAAALRPQAIQLARVLIAPGAQWPDVCKLLKGLDGEDPEQLRWMVLNYSKSVLLGGGKLTPRAAFLIEVFQRNWYDSKFAGLALACYEACTYKPR